MVLENVNTSQRVILWCLYLQDLTFSCSYSHCCSRGFQINMDLFDNCFNQHYFDLSFNVKKFLLILVLVVVIFLEVEDLINNCLILLLG